MSLVIPVVVTAASVLLVVVLSWLGCKKQEDRVSNGWFSEYYRQRRDNG